jgi:hypothetical protein
VAGKTRIGEDTQTPQTVNTPVQTTDDRPLRQTDVNLIELEQLAFHGLRALRPLPDHGFLETGTPHAPISPEKCLPVSN